jgi:hypothetical protein
MIERRMTAHEYAAEVAYMWSEMTDTWVSDNLIEQLADDLQAGLDRLTG